MKNNKNKSEHKGKSKKSLKDKELPRVSGGIGNIDINAYGVVEPDHNKIGGTVDPFVNNQISRDNSGGNNFNFFNPHFKE